MNQEIINNMLKSDTGSVKWKLLSEQRICTAFGSISHRYKLSKKEFLEQALEKYKKMVCMKEICMEHIIYGAGQRGKRAFHILGSERVAFLWTLKAIKQAHFIRERKSKRQMPAM